MSSWHSYNKIYQVGHPAVEDLFRDDVLVEEKLDGSQFSFGRIEGGELRCRSKGHKLILDAPDKMFIRAVETAEGLNLREGWTYRAEYLQKPKHNTISYERTPEKYLIIFDINTDVENYLSREEKEEEAKRIGLEIVPLLHNGPVKTLEEMKSFMDRISILGGSKIEGMVFKNYKRFGKDGKCLMGKYVSEEFKEQNSKEFRKANPKQGDILIGLGDQYRTEARWKKAIIHMKEDGSFTGTVKDIGPLIKRIQQDVEEECIDEIKETLYRWAEPHIKRKMNYGFVEWFKEELAKKAFE